MTALSRSYHAGRRYPAQAAIAVALTGVMFFTFLFTVAALWARCQLAWWIFPSAVLAAIVTALATVPSAMREGASLSVAAATVIVVLAATGVAYFTVDSSFDGIYYHQEIIAALCNGWNPFAPPYDIIPPYTPWAVHYAKAVEISAAAIVSCTGAIETGKAINIIAVASLAACVSTCLREQAGRLAAHSRLLTAAAIANPVVCAQLLSYYIDFYKYVYLVWALAAFIDIAAGRRRGTVILFMTLVLAMATKFNIFFEAGLWVAAAMAWWGVRGNGVALKRVTLTGVAALAVGCALTYHPYVTNWLQAGHPLYPLMGEGAEDIMTGNTPAEFLGRSRFVTFFLSLLSVNLPSVAQPIGGFTPLMPLILILSLWSLWCLRGKIPGAMLYAAVLVTVSCFFFEQAWWARYICQLWLVPVIIVIAAFRAGVAAKASRLTAWLMIAAGVSALLFTSKEMLVRGGYQQLMLHTAAAEPEVLVTGQWWGPQFERHMDEAGIRYRYVTEMPDTTGRTVLYYYEQNDPLIIISAEGADKIRKSLESLHFNYTRHEYHSAR